MDRTPQHQTGLSRRLITGVTLVATATIVMIATAYASSVASRRTGELSFPNPSGVVATVGLDDTELRQSVLPGARNKRSDAA